MNKMGTLYCAKAIIPSSNYPRDGGDEQTVNEVPFEPGKDDLVGKSFFFDEFCSYFVESLLEGQMVVVDGAFLGVFERA